jgi:hypothetical protein
LPTLTSQLGGVGAVGVLVALAALGFARRWVALAGGVVALGFTSIALLDVRFVSSVGASELVFGAASRGGLEFQLAEVLFQCFGVAGLVVTGCVAWRLLREDGAAPATRFLLLWLGLELLGFAAMTPFPAVRRVLGVWVVLALLVGRLAARTCATGERRRTLRGLVTAGAVLALGFLALDWRGAQAHREAAEAAARWVREHEGAGETIWYVGHWGFQYYAERSGMRGVVTDTGSPPDPGDSSPPPSRLRAGDWLVVPDRRISQQGLRIDPQHLEAVGQVVILARVPLRTVPCFYGGRTPLEHHEGSRLQVTIYRVRRDFVPAHAEVPLLTEP